MFKVRKLVCRCYTGAAPVKRCSDYSYGAAYKYNHLGAIKPKTFVSRRKPEISGDHRLQWLTVKLRDVLAESGEVQAGLRRVVEPVLHFVPQEICRAQPLF